MKTKIKELEMSLRNDPSILARVLCEILFNIQQELDDINERMIQLNASLGPKVLCADNYDEPIGITSNGTYVYRIKPVDKNNIFNGVI